ELHRTLELDAALAEETCQRAVDDSGADLTLDVVADDRQVCLLEAVAPVLLAANEDRDAVDEATASLQHLLDIPLGGCLAADGQVVDNDVGAGVLEDVDDVGGRARSLGDDLREVLAEAVMGHASDDLDARRRDLGELIGVVGAGEDCLAQVLADLRYVDVD